jgi:hypothetical protein
MTLRVLWVSVFWFALRFSTPKGNAIRRLCANRMKRDVPVSLCACKPEATNHMRFLGVNLPVREKTDFRR